MGGPSTTKVRYRDRVVEVRPGETLLAALSRRGLPILERSARYRRPRGPFCGIGQCTGCLVRVNDRPLVRACRHRPADGDVVANESGWPSVRFDLFGAVDLLTPGGLDPFRGFRRPGFLVPLYQRVVRRLSGYGRYSVEVIPSAPGPVPIYRSTDIAIIGAGTSGRAAAERLVSLGARPLLLDRAPGSAAPDGAERIGNASVSMLTPPTPDGPREFSLLGFVENGGGFSVRARTVVVATGGYDGPLLFAGNDRPGVVTADLVLGLTPDQERSWFRRAALVGGGPRAREVLDRLGQKVAAVIAPGEVRPEVVRAASDLDIPIYPRSLILAAQGRKRIRRLELAARGQGPHFSLACDGVVLAHRRLPNSSLLFQGGVEMEWRAGTGAYYPTVEPAGRTSVPGLYAIGEVAGVGRADARASGERVADAIAPRSVTAAAPAEALPRVPRDGPSELEGYYRELLGERRSGRWVACRCEDVLLDDVERAHRAGYRGIEVLKRHTSLGAGLCQGRYCLPDALLLLAIREERPPSEVGYIRQRPPVYPTPLAALASLDPTGPAERP